MRDCEAYEVAVPEEFDRASFCTFHQVVAFARHVFLQTLQAPPYKITACQLLITDAFFYRHGSLFAFMRLQRSLNTLNLHE